MIRSPLGLRLASLSSSSIREWFSTAAAMGAKGLILDAVGELSPDQLGETGRRDLRHTLRSVELALIALHLPTRRPFDTEEQLDERLARAERAFVLAYELGSRLVLARLGPLPDESETDRRAIYARAVTELGRRADHRGVQLAIETGTESGESLRAFLDSLGELGLGASIDPGPLLQNGFDPIEATRSLGPRVLHAYARDASATPTNHPITANPRGFGFSPGVLDWEEYLGSLEEIGYAGYLTIWPDPNRPIEPQFASLVERFQRF